MKTFEKNVPVESQVNSINRDLLLVLLSGLVVALAIGTIAVIIVGKILN